MDHQASSMPLPERTTGNYSENPNSDYSNGDYPPRREAVTTGHTRVSSTTSIKSINSEAKDTPRVLGLPLKYVSLVTLALQNASLAIIMHYSRVSVAPDKVYSAASAVLLNEMLKGIISFAIAFIRTKPVLDTSRGYDLLPSTPTTPAPSVRSPMRCSSPASYVYRLRHLLAQIASADSWKLSIPALLYVLQNNLQYIAVSNLDVPTFQVTNQAKILTTAGFSVLLLRKRLNGWKWTSLALLAVGVGVVQIQASSHTPTPPTTTGLSKEGLTAHGEDRMDSPHSMDPIKGFLAVSAACFTSGLAGVYFEMVLKGSKADLWVRNVQLSLWSLIPALLPVVVSLARDGVAITDMFINFGGWAWTTVLTQVAGGLITALVIKYADNILKGFATSLSIILSSVLSVFLFNLHITPTFIVGSTIVLGATWMYNTPDSPSGQQEKGTTTGGIMLQGREEAPLINGTSEEHRKSADLEYIVDGGGDENGRYASLAAPIESHEPLLGYPNGVGSSTGASHSKKPLRGGKLLEKVSNIVGSTSGNGRPGKENQDEKTG